MAFDPDKYLASKPEVAPVNVAKGFDPDAYLAVSQGNIINTDVPTVAGQVPNPPIVQPKRTMMDRVKALYEVPLTAASAAVAGPVSSAYGVYKSATSPEFGTPQGTQVGQQAASDLARRMTYTPTSPVAQEFLQDVSQVAGEAKLPPVIPTTGMLPSYARMVQATPPQARQIGQVIQETGPKIAQALRREEPTMAGVGSAAVPEAVTRAQMAQQLRVPVQLTKGQATKELGQQQFEIETAKTYPQDVGKPIIERKLDQNQRILSNFDAFIEPIGAKTAAPMNLYEVGKVVDSALVKRANDAKKQIRDAYKKADEAGETQELIDVKPLQAYLNGLEAEAINAPIITSAKMKLDKLAPNGEISINQLEEIRKMVGKLSGSTPTNMQFGKEITSLIDTSTEGKGGNLYQDARKLRSNYAREFENVGVVDKLLSKKAGTTDRAVAFEDVFNHAILKGSLDDVRAISRTLKRAGPEGQQAYRELLAQTLEYMREGITKNIQRDANNNPIVSSKQFDTIVKNLDSSGKLDYLFGKKGAEEIRNLRDTAILVYDVPQGINTANTSSAFIKVFERVLKEIPIAGRMVEAGSEALEKQKIAKQVQESINYSPSKMAEELKKGSKK